MEDLVHSPITETIPELLVEARQEVQAEMEQVAMTEATAVMHKMVEQGQIDPMEAEMQLQSTTTQETATSAPSGVQEPPAPSEIQEHLAPSEIREPPESTEAREATPRGGDTESTPSDFDPEHWTQGRVASPKTIREQKELVRKGVYLVVATPIGVGTPDIFVTSLADPPLSLQEQKDIRKRGGQILYSLTDDSYDISCMAVDSSLFPPRRSSESPGAGPSGTAPRTNVVVTHSADIEGLEGRNKRLFLRF